MSCSLYFSVQQRIGSSDISMVVWSIFLMTPLILYLPSATCSHCPYNNRVNFIRTGKGHNGACTTSNPRYHGCIGINGSSFIIRRIFCTISRGLKFGMNELQPYIYLIRARWFRKPNTMIPPVPIPSEPLTSTNGIIGVYLRMWQICSQMWIQTPNAKTLPFRFNILSILI